MIHYKDCHKLHFAHIFQFKRAYKIEQLQTMKANKQKLRFTPMRTYKYPLHDECIKNAYDVEVMPQIITEEYEKIAVNYPENFIRRSYFRRNTMLGINNQENNENLKANRNAGEKVMTEKYI